MTINFFKCVNLFIVIMYDTFNLYFVALSRNFPVAGNVREDKNIYFYSSICKLNMLY